MQEKTPLPLVTMSCLQCLRGAHANRLNQNLYGMNPTIILVRMYVVQLSFASHKLKQVWLVPKCLYFNYCAFPTNASASHNITSADTNCNPTHTTCNSTHT